VLAALQWLHAELDRPVWLVGWSFGADVSLQVVHEAVAGWVAVTPPLASVDVEAMAAAHDRRCKLLLVAEHDQFCDPATARGRTLDWTATEVGTIPGADHFLAGRLSWVTDRVLGELA
jgi:alpha/beta superfamily hydrolase